MHVTADFYMYLMKRKKYPIPIWGWKIYY